MFSPNNMNKFVQVSLMCCKSPTKREIFKNIHTSIQAMNIRYYKNSKRELKVGIKKALKTEVPQAIKIYIDFEKPFNLKQLKELFLLRKLKNV